MQTLNCVLCDSYSKGNFTKRAAKFKCDPLCQAGQLSLNQLSVQLMALGSANSSAQPQQPSSANPWQNQLAALAMKQAAAAAAAAAAANGSGPNPLGLPTPPPPPLPPPFPPTELQVILGLFRGKLLADPGQNVLLFFLCIL